jgi:hypothetical protein
MPLLTAAIIVCGALPAVNSPLVCRAQVYHNLQGDQRECSAASIRRARASESAFVKVGSLVRTKSHAECFYADDEGSVVFYLPEFMAVQLGADSSTVAEYDVIYGVPVDRASEAIAKGI